MRTQARGDRQGVDARPRRRGHRRRGWTRRGRGERRTAELTEAGARIAGRTAAQTGTCGRWARHRRNTHWRCVHRHRRPQRGNMRGFAGSRQIVAAGATELMTRCITCPTSGTNHGGIVRRRCDLPRHGGPARVAERVAQGIIPMTARANHLSSSGTLRRGGVKIRESRKLPKLLAETHCARKPADQYAGRPAQPHAVVDNPVA